jgi:hypothetical protein
MKLNKKTVANIVYWTIMGVLCLLAYVGICFNLFCIFTWKGVLIAHLVAIFCCWRSYFTIMGRGQQKG